METVETVGTRVEITVVGTVTCVTVEVETALAGTAEVSVEMGTET